MCRRELCRCRCGRFRWLGRATVIVTVLAASPSRALGQSDSVAVFAESFEDGLEAWEEQRLDRRSSDFRVIAVAGNEALAVTSEDAAGAVLRPLRSGPVRASRLRWRWSVEQSLTGNDEERAASGDDYAARVLALFGKAELSEDTRAIAYVWAGQEPIGSSYTNPNLPQVETIVLQSGDEQAGSWVTEERPVSADYRNAFGEAAPPVSAIAIIVDTDDTDASTTAWFDDFELWGSTGQSAP